MNKKMLTPIAAALGTTFVVSLAASPIAQADENPFSMTQLSSGYMQLAEGNCGEQKKAEGSCGENKEGMEEEKKAEGNCGEKKEEKKAEGSCGH